VVAVVSAAVNRKIHRWVGREFSDAFFYLFTLVCLSYQWILNVVLALLLTMDFVNLRRFYVTPCSILKI
jgi:hypothetical protein